MVTSTQVPPTPIPYDPTPCLTTCSQSHVTLSNKSSFPCSIKPRPKPESIGDHRTRVVKKKKKKTWPSPTLLVPLLLLLSPLSCPFYPLPCNLIRTCSQPTSMHPFQTGDPFICPSPPALCIHSLFCTLHRKYHPPCFMFLHLQLHTPLCLFVYLRLLHLGSLLHVPTGFDAANVPSPPYTHPSLGSLPPPSLFPSLFVLPLACFMTRTMFSCFLLYLSKSLQNM